MSDACAAATRRPSASWSSATGRRSGRTRPASSAIRRRLRTPRRRRSCAPSAASAPTAATRPSGAGSFASAATTASTACAPGRPRRWSSTTIWRPRPRTPPRRPTRPSIASSSSSRVARLSEPLQQVIVLRELRGLSYEEVAESPRRARGHGPLAPVRRAGRAQAGADRVSTPSDDRFADRVMDRLARQERRLPAVVVGAVRRRAGARRAGAGGARRTARPRGRGGPGGGRARGRSSAACSTTRCSGRPSALASIWLAWLASVAVRGRR